MQALLFTHPMRLIQTPTITVMLLEEFWDFRQIFTDGRPLPIEPDPAWFGYSIGTWEDETFVVTTIGINERSMLDAALHPHTDALKTIERYRRPDFGHLELELTIDDAKAYTRPWTVSIAFDYYADNDLIEHTCENEADFHHIGQAN